MDTIVFECDDNNVTSISGCGGTCRNTRNSMGASEVLTFWQSSSVVHCNLDRSAILRSTLGAADTFAVAVAAGVVVVVAAAAEEEAVAAGTVAVDIVVVAVVGEALAVAVDTSFLGHAGFLVEAGRTVCAA